MLTLGVDPDLHSPAFLFYPTLRPLIVKLPRAQKGRGAVISLAQEVARALDDGEVRRLLLDTEHVAIESQQIYTTGPYKTKRPDDILVLASVSGVILSLLQRLSTPKTKFHLPQPQAWKGSTPKEVHQARLYHKLGWGYIQKTDYAVPEHPPASLAVDLGGRKVLEGDWKHLGDALGLAKWVGEQAGVLST